MDYGYSYSSHLLWCEDCRHVMALGLQCRAVVPVRGRSRRRGWTEGGVRGWWGRGGGAWWILCTTWGSFHVARPSRRCNLSIRMERYFHGWNDEIGRASCRERECQ